MAQYSSNGEKRHAQNGSTNKNSSVSPNLLATVKAAKAAIKADNESAKAERNARRWKTERDPAEYEQQKENQREQYAAAVLADQGREVRAYHKIDAKTKAEREKIVQERAAKRMQRNRMKASQDTKDREADRKFRKRKEAAGWTAEEIAAGLRKLQADRALGRSNDYLGNPDYGKF
ncbi:MAG: hypothetical protein RIE24_03625 [Silicimonas sp.]|uniref:hypothetical protein n=1 Tax=Alphaproteobacteria TaxID=28211 RepID=UPI0032F01A5A